MLTVCQGADLTRWQDGQRVERSALATGQAPGSARVEVTPEVEAEALAKLVTEELGRSGAPGELPGRTLVTERVAARSSFGLAGLEVKPGSVAEPRGLPNTPRIRHPPG